MSNPFDLLGNDVEDASVVSPPPMPREIVKQSTSTRKSDVPPAKANPAKAKNNRPKATGNEKAYKDRSAGRQQNARKEVSGNATGSRRSKDERKKTDRHSKTGKTDSKKKLDQTWGADSTELNDEEAAEADAKEELIEDATEKKMSLEAYLSSVAAGSDLNTLTKTAPADNVAGAAIAAKEQEVFAKPTKVKTLKSKQLKTKEVLEFDATFADSNPRGGFRGGRGGRGNHRGGRGGHRGGKSNAQEKPKTLDTKNLPSLA